jgi:manganese-dependent ADP-ribose/CDP-alcohol diphosphatase
MANNVKHALTRREFLITAVGGVLVTSLAGCISNKTMKTAGPFSFGIMADVQYADYERLGNRCYRDSKWKLKQCVEDFNSRDLSFVIQLGDLIDGGFNNFDRMLQIYQQLKAEKYHVLGNHDFAAHRDKVLEKHGLDRGYYDFAVNRWRFIVLDGNEISLYANSKDSEEYKQAKAINLRLKEASAANAKTWNGALSSRQMAWLKNVLDKSKISDEKVIVFCHFPVWPPNAHNLWNDSKLVELFESYDCVAAYINGHNHAGNYAVKKGIHYLTLHAMVESPDKIAYAVVEVYSDRLKVVGFGAEPEHLLFIHNPE